MRPAMTCSRLRTCGAGAASLEGSTPSHTSATDKPELALTSVLLTRPRADPGEAGNLSPKETGLLADPGEAGNLSPKETGLFTISPLSSGTGPHDKPEFALTKVLLVRTKGLLVQSAVLVCSGTIATGSPCGFGAE